MSNDALTVRDGENIHDFARRVGWKTDAESFATFVARREREDAALRQDGGDEPSASAARAAMLARKHATRVDEDEGEGGDDVPEADAARARRDFLKRKTDGWKTPKKDANQGPKPPKSASEKRAEEEGEEEEPDDDEPDDDDDDDEEEEFDAVAAKAASDAKKRDAWKAGRK